MKHIQLFEDFNSERAIMKIDLLKHFPDMYITEPDPEGNEEIITEPQAHLYVYEVGSEPEVMNSVNDGDVKIDPSFHTGKIKLKLEVDSNDSLGYGAINTIFIGVDELSEKSILDWFKDLLDDSSRDYLSW